MPLMLCARLRVAVIAAARCTGRIPVSAARPERVMADAAPASPSAAAAEAPVAAADPRLEALAPIGPSSAEVYAVVPSLRAALLETLPADTKLWGAELLNPDDKAGATVLGKFLRARDMSVELAAKMVKSTLEWRVTYGADAIASDTSVPACLADIAQLMGKARSGHPVLWFDYGPLAQQVAWDAAFHHGKVGDGPLIRSRVKLLEAGIAKFDFAAGLDAPNAFVLVHDMRDAPLASLLVSADASSGVVQMVKTANEYYPDMSIKHVFLYAPTLLSGVLLMLKPFLSSRTQRKLLWAPPHAELLTLLQLMPLSAIPARHGGFGGLGPPAGEVNEAEVAAGREVCVALRTMGEGSQAHWLVSVADHTVALRVEFVPLASARGGGSGIQLLESTTVVVGDASPGACTGTVEGAHLATQAGHVRLTFDNAASWLTAKHVFYAAGVRATPIPLKPRTAGGGIAPAPRTVAARASGYMRADAYAPPPAPLSDAEAPPGSAV